MTFGLSMTPEILIKINQYFLVWSGALLWNEYFTKYEWRKIAYYNISFINFEGKVTNTDI